MIDWEWKAIDDLEAQEDYGQAMYQMYVVWQKDRMNLKVFLRLSFLVWIIVVEPFMTVDTSDIEEDYIDFVPLLNDLEKFGQNHFQQHAEFLWMYGYMIYMFPFYFEADDETIASEMYQKAYDLQPDDPIVKMLYLEDNKNYKGIFDRRALREEVAQTLPERFRGNGEMQEYFRHVLNKNSKY